MDTLCKGILVKQKLNNGFLGGPKAISFDYNSSGKNYAVSISQCGIREITLRSTDEIDIDEFWSLFNSIDMLLMLMEGKFIPIMEAFVLDDTEQISSDILTGYIQNRVRLYQSADYTRGSHSSFLDYSYVLDKDILQKWSSMAVELDILHNVVLYSMADTGLPVDSKCAFLIESFEALAELINNYIVEFTLPTVSKGESKLGKRLNKIIECYGTDIFRKEITASKDMFIDILVSSRNRIAHIKSKQGKKFLDGPESVLYCVKLSYLYRRVLLELLGINYSCYSAKFKESVENWDEWNGILNQFLAKLQ